MKLDNFPGFLEDNVSENDPTDFGLEYDELEVDDSCWIFTEVGVLRGSIVSVHGSGINIRYDVKVYVKKNENEKEKVIIEDKPSGLVYSLYMPNFNMQEKPNENEWKNTDQLDQYQKKINKWRNKKRKSKREKHLRLTRMWQETYLYR